MILIADDDQAVRLSISLALKRAGFDTKCVSNEDDVIESIRDPHVELAVVDMNLRLETTGRQGVEILRKIKLLRPEMPVILLTAWGTIPLAVKTINLGAADFMTKPWSNKDLLDKIKSALSQAQKVQEEHNRVDTLDSLEREAIAKTLRLCDGNLSDAAKRLGITRQALYRRIEKYGL